jgi:hypothetical protein
LRAPGRVHLDPMGNVHLCQGIVMGNIRRTPLAEILAGYDPKTHPIVGPLVRGGPAQLAREHGLEFTGESVDACHLCFRARRELRDRFPELLTPPQMYGVAG